MINIYFALQSSFPSVSSDFHSRSVRPRGRFIKIKILSWKIFRPSFNFVSTFHCKAKGEFQVMGSEKLPQEMSQ